MKVKCNTCGKEIERMLCRIKKHKYFFCNVSCRRKFQKFFTKPKEGKYIKCPNCGNENYRPKCHLDKYKHHFCNHKCMSLFIRGDKHHNYKKIKSKETIEKQRKSMKGKNKGKENGIWKGDDVSYHALHSWIKRNKPKPEFCECCNKEKSYEIANISGKYKRDVDDFEWLCRKCHMKKDGRINNLKQYSNIGKGNKFSD